MRLRKPAVVAWMKRRPFLSALVVLTAVVAPGYWRIENTVRGLNEARQESRVAGCRQHNEQVYAFNDTANQQNENVKATFVAALETLRRPEATPEQRAREDAVIGLYAAEVDRRLATPPTLERRDCTADGLDAYYSTTTSGER